MFVVFRLSPDKSGIRGRHAGVDWPLLRVVATGQTNAPATGLEDSWSIRAPRAMRHSHHFKKERSMRCCRCGPTHLGHRERRRIRLGSARVPRFEGSASSEAELVRLRR
jgi:hypothetical protein